MKALSGYAEWFWLMAMNWKDIENRNWSLYSKGIRPMDLPLRIYLHASKTKTPKDEMDFIISCLSPRQKAEFDNVIWEHYRGHIIGEVTLTGQVTASDSKWFFGKFGFLVFDGKLYNEPIPYRGQLGFFEVSL